MDWPGVKNLSPTRPRSRGRTSRREPITLLSLEPPTPLDPVHTVGPLTAPNQSQAESSEADIADIVRGLGRPAQTGAGSPRSAPRVVPLSCTCVSTDAPGGSPRRRTGQGPGVVHRTPWARRAQPDSDRPDSASASASASTRDGRFSHRRNASADTHRGSTYCVGGVVRQGWEMGADEEAARRRELIRLIGACVVVVRTRGSGSGFGTGFLVSEDTVLTCAHVVHGHTTVDVMSGTGPDTVEAAVVRTVPAERGTGAVFGFPDLARLRLTSPINGAGVWLGGETPLPGNEVVVHGFSRHTLEAGEQPDTLRLLVAGQAGSFVRLQWDTVVQGLAAARSWTCAPVGYAAY
ncbi:trypsin-like peptidase domain-containing protein [Streptomyces sp. NPDC093509]|uniref:trypsin-like peptidase domain-containing protein n=1 Tax=Streptomyces sp. NPDC093509 TaxID=3154982 RepID=UPI00344DAA02